MWSRRQRPLNVRFAGHRGVALVSVLLIVALGTILAADLFHRLQLDLRRSLTLNSAERAYQYSRGLEHWAITALRRDRENSGSVDSRTEPWATGLPVIDLDEGRLTGSLTDLDGRFNLNNLVLEGQRQPAQIEQFQRLLEALTLDPGIAEAVADWQDQDLIAEAGGAEDPAYTLLQPPYRAANGRFRHISELRLIAGINPEVYQRLRSHVTVLPNRDGLARINVNTASVPVLMSLHPDITENVARTLNQDGQARYESIDEFVEHPLLSGLALQGLTQTISVGSLYFNANGVLEINGVLQHFQSLIEQDGREYRVLYRARGLSADGLGTPLAQQ